MARTSYDRERALNVTVSEYRVTETTTLRRAAVIGAVLLAVTLLLHAAGIRNLVQQWMDQEEYSHGFLIPVVSAWLLWSRREAIIRALDRPSLWAAAAAASAVVLFLASKATNVYFFEHVGLVISLFAVALAVGGVSLLTMTFVPIAYLFFMIPLPYFLTALLTGRMQLWASELGAFFIRLADIPVFLDGNVIDLGEYQLGVVEACSGLNYMFPFLSLSFLAAYMVNLRLVPRLILFVSAVPITILMNSARIGFIGIIVHHFGTAHAEGFIHYFEGWVVFVICIALLIVEILVMAWLTGTPWRKLLRAVDGESGFAAAGDRNSTAGRQTGSLVPAAVTAGLLCLALVAVQLWPDRDAIRPDRKKLINLAYEIDGWEVARITNLEPSTEAVLGADDYVVADLVDADNNSANLYIAYLDEKRGKQTWHSPQVCIPGGGWRITNLERIDIEDAQGETFRANRVEITRGDAKQLVYYWYQQRGRRFASEWTVRYFVVLDGLIRNRTDGAMIRLVTGLPPDQPPEAADNRLRALVKTMSPRLPDYVPD